MGSAFRASFLLFLWRPESQSAAVAVDCTKGCRWRRQGMFSTLRNLSLTHTRISSAASVNCCPRSAQCQYLLADVSVWCVCDITGQERSAVALSSVNEQVYSTRVHAEPRPWHTDSAWCEYQMQSACMTALSRCFTAVLSPVFYMETACDCVYAPQGACDDGLMSWWWCGVLHTHYLFVLIMCSGCAVQ